MSESDIAEMTARYAFWGIVIGSAITSIIGGALLAWLNRRFNRSHANEQAGRDRRNHKISLAHNDRSAAYGELDEWISVVLEQVDGICYSKELPNLPHVQRDHYHVCVALTQGPMRLPRRGRYLWSPAVAQQVHEFQTRAIAIAQLMIVDRLDLDDEHGHGVFEEMAVLLRQTMSDHLEGRDEDRHDDAQVPRPRSSRWWKTSSSAPERNNLTQ